MLVGKLNKADGSPWGGWELSNLLRAQTEQKGGRRTNSLSASAEASICLCPQTLALLGPGILDSDWNLYR